METMTIYSEREGGDEALGRTVQVRKGGDLVYRLYIKGINWEKGKLIKSISW